MNKRRFLVGSVAWAASATAYAQADGSVVRYGGDAAFPPFESLGPDGKPQGFQIDLLNALARATGLRFDIRLRPWAETEADFRAGRLDVVAMVDTAERRRWAAFTSGHATPVFAVYQPPGAVGPQSLQALTGQRIAVLDGAAMRDTLIETLPGLQAPLLRSPDAEAALAALARGEADVAVLPRAYADPLLAASAVPGATAGRLDLALQTYALAVAPDRQALRMRLQTGLDRLEASGELEALRVRWLGSHRQARREAQAAQRLTDQRSRTTGLVAGGATVLALVSAWAWRRGRRVAVERGARASAESALKRATDLLDQTFARNPEPMLILERDGARVRDANPALYALLGVTAPDLIGRALPTLDRHVDVEAWAGLVRSFDASGDIRGAALQLRRADGGVRECLISAERLEVDGQAQVFCAIRDITEQLAHDATLRAGYDALTRQLATAQAEAGAARTDQRRAESRLDEFTRVVTHDLKAPLRAMAGYAGILRDRLQAGHVLEAIGLSDHIGQAARRMDGMVAALGRLAQVTQRPPLRLAVDMTALARAVWTMLERARPERRTRFDLDPLAPAVGDPDLLAQVWQNLLENAAKYSVKSVDPQVRVDSHVNDGRLWYRVTDNGAGFDMARAGLLFQPFQRMHAATEFEGSGIGLSLVQRIVERHGGEVRLRSAPGIGTVAEFTLEAAGAAAPASRSDP